MTTHTRYTLTDVQRYFFPGVIQRARGYTGTVLSLRRDGDTISGEVQGSEPAAYRVGIRLGIDLGGTVTIQSECSCPVRNYCKHAAAVLLRNLNADPHSPLVSPGVVDWLEHFRTVVVQQESASPELRRPTPQDVLFYLLETPSARSPEWRVGFRKGRYAKDRKSILGLTRWANVERALVQPPRFVSDEDVRILRLFWIHRTRHGDNESFPLRGRNAQELLALLIASERLLWAVGSGTVPLRAGEARTGHFEWQRNANAQLIPRVSGTPPITAVLPLDQVWYLDADAASIGVLELPIAGPKLAALLAIPALSETDATVVASALGEMAPDIAPPAAAPLRVIEQTPVPVLTLGTVEVYGIGGFRHYRYNARCFDYAVPAVRYGEFLMDVDRPVEFAISAAGETVKVRRSPNAETHWLEALSRHGLMRVPARAIYTYSKLPTLLFGLESEAHWAAFMADQVPALRAAGWDVVIPRGFRHSKLQVEDWVADFREGEDGWFSLDIGIVVEGRRLALPPLLYDLYRRDPRWLDAVKLPEILDDEAIELTTLDGDRVQMPARRLKPLARTLIDLFDDKPGATLRISRFDASRLAEVTAMERWTFHGAEAAQALANRLRQSEGIKPAEPPRGLTLQLRAYQLEGLAWLQFLREQELGGILADDMGLGKTAQTLAHLLLEKEAGRLDRPALVVLPTSLLFNWKREAERFAPGLKLLSLHGKDRHERFEEIPASDVALTTYPLLWRDQEELSAFHYRWLILDEAQTVKNAASQAAQVVRKLDASHRLCLTGTPLENHLGELWAQFDFLLPGFLGDAKSFARSWRTPIEKHGDTLRRDLLARRLKPFILRRRKDEVAKELPPKSIIVRTVELDAGQRDLYETVRSAMNIKVREAIAEKGYARSQIVILDALLKLRQVCCDPRLLKSAEAAKVKERAKLDLLMDMLPELVDEGRRVLVFSQFAAMLDLIGKELTQRKLPFVCLTGDTRDREGVIGRFQNGEVPLFLISLKAGGVGLNLTAADTVIHYDPWWNPAVENQATDRAHRIGQTKPVFVYKLVVAGSIEEKILALQEKKAELAAGILSEDSQALTKFSESDIQSLLAPLPK